jgi:hypothetical protein
MGPSATVYMHVFILQDACHCNFTHVLHNYLRRANVDRMVLVTKLHVNRVEVDWVEHILERYLQRYLKGEATSE